MIKYTFLYVHETHIKLYEQIYISQQENTFDTRQIDDNN